ncbi:UDP-N-acetyl-D-mannosamine dehydrogenase [Paenarthrobacter ureafaciens]|uniref:UDP-N-acetyl-D-mannosamine dehydrogenase n=1 Tax=Paenarthrobacter ureafaciens TaxID=37931 RepID=UPI001917179C|nr:UDP-N-acetyl-D-mannosamine dehydrogenase [Paenarthrobacter ureafaciens]QQQ61661.1 UDP-N-acetyl-D-mannosamine dehydrogenase [Paenarthrobacter ureafaciens]
MNTVRTVAVIGLGYIGLPTAAILATNGITVVGVDVNQKTVDAVNRGEVPFVEPDLGIHVAGAVSQGRLSATTITPPADAYIVAVPTPFLSDRSADLSFIEAAGRNIAPQLRGGELIILESTSPPGSTELLRDLILGERPDLATFEDDEQSVLFAHCPERVLPGRIMIELVTNDRIVGGLTTRAAEAAGALYSVFCQGAIHLTDAATAEMAKLVENAYRDVNIAFANELSVISGTLGIDVWELIELANHHPRVNILQPGPGVGGHCIAVDPWFIVAADRDNSRLIQKAREVNDSKPNRVVRDVLEAAGSYSSPKVAALGLAFKANIDDMRESPAVEIVNQLGRELSGGTILVGDPHVESLPAVLHGLENVRLTETHAAVAESDIVLLLVDHDMFREIDTALLGNKKVVDTRGFWRHKAD